jgi:hypothetical protein
MTKSTAQVPDTSAHEPGTGNVPDAARREELRRRVTASRVAQGLPPFTDPVVLARIADLLIATSNPAGTSNGRARVSAALQTRPTSTPASQRSAVPPTRARSLVGTGYAGGGLATITPCGTGWPPS